MVLGPVARLMTRSLYALINTRQAWCEFLTITEEAKAEIQFWLTEIQKFNGQDIWLGPSALRVVHSDASNAGYGGYTVEHGYYYSAWPEEVDKSSTWRKIRAVRMVLEALKSKLRNKRVRWFTDNQNVARILMVGSKKNPTSSQKP